MYRVFREGRELTAKKLEDKDLEAVDSELRREILRVVAEKPDYPASVAKKLDISKQKTYYHFQKLKDAGLLEVDTEEKKSGGLATFYRPAAEAFVVDNGAEGRETFVPSDSRPIRRFFSPMISKGKINGKVVVGSSREHGPDQVRARDGHLAGDIAAKIGNFGDVAPGLTKLDTDISRENGHDQTLVILGGVLTNTVAKKFNKAFPVKFSGESFPYREIKTPRNTYDDPEIGFVSKATNPENPEESVYIIAGVRNQGTRAAVIAFQNIEDLLEDYKGGEFYKVVKGLDMDGDGRIDDYEVVE